MALPPAIFNFRTRPDSVNCSSLCPLSDRGLRFGRNPSPLDSTTSSWDAKFSFRPCSVTNRQAEKCLTAGIDGPMGPLKDPAVKRFLAGTVRRYWGITIIDPKSCTDRRADGWSGLDWNSADTSTTAPLPSTRLVRHHRALQCSIDAARITRRRR